MAKRFGIAEWLYSKYEKDLLEFDVELLVFAYSQATEKHIENLPEEEREQEFERILTNMAEQMRAEIEAKAAE